MKKISLILLLLSIMSCSKKTQVTNELVEFYIDYQFPESGSMYTKSEEGDAAYSNFKKGYIETRKVTPSKYNLVFKNNETGALTNIEGHWEKKEGFRLPAGDYIVSGYSRPDEITESSRQYFVTDTAYLAFSQNLTISPASESIILNAQYDSYLMIFDKDGIDRIGQADSRPESFAKTEDIIYAFIPPEISDSYYPVFIYRTDGDRSYIYLDQLKGENGKYYYFKDIDYSFTLPDMGAGN